MIKGIVFDKDGTILDYEKFWVPIAKNAVELMLKSRDTLSYGLTEEILKGIGAYEGISGLLCYGTYAMITDEINSITARCGFSIDRFTTQEVEEAFEKCISCGVLMPTCHDIVGCFKQLKAMDLTVALITNDNRSLTEKCLDGLGITEYFDAIYTADGIHPSKPDPYFMNLFREQFGLEKNEVLMVGDTLTDMQYAENSGVLGVGVAKTARDKVILSSATETVVHDISYVADLIQNKVCDILK